MENGIKRILLKGLCLSSLSCLSLSVLAQEASAGSAAAGVPVITPDVTPVPVQEALIDDENFEIGLVVGFISIEDFETSLLLGARLAYHINESLFVEANYAMAEAGETSFEKLGGDVILVPDDDRDYSYYNLSLGYNLLPGEGFIGSYAFNTNFFLVGGMGATDFAGDSELTFNFGAGYQVLITDAVALSLTMRQHMYDNEILGEKKTSANLEYGLGASWFF